MMREFIGGAVVSQKRGSDKMSWCTHEDRAKLDRETESAINVGHWGARGVGYDVKRYRFRYRINVYRRAPLAALSGPMGRVV